MRRGAKDKAAQQRSEGGRYHIAAFLAVSATCQASPTPSNTRRFPLIRLVPVFPHQGAVRSWVDPTFIRRDAFRRGRARDALVGVTPERDRLVVGLVLDDSLPFLSSQAARSLPFRPLVEKRDVLPVVCGRAAGGVLLSWVGWAGGSGEGEGRLCTHRPEATSLIRITITHNVYSGFSRV